MTEQINAKIAPHITEIIRRLQEAGFEAYIVGGAVRDFILDRQPKDYDLSTSATPEQIKKVFRDRRVMIIGKRFRLAHYYYGDDIIEISTFRKNPSETGQQTRPGRTEPLPEHMIFRDNEFGTAREDAFRRDFSINAIFYDPVHDQMLDYTGFGLDDIRNGIVRIIGNADLRFEEDPVRILRALKLIGQYGFKLESGTEAALNRCLPLVVHASKSRLTLELEKIIKNPYGDRILTVFRHFGFLHYFLPYLDERFDTPEAQYAMRLLECRNQRLRDGKYRDSISLVLSIFTLAFAERLVGGNVPGGLWEYQPELEPELRSLLFEIFAPHANTKRSTAAAIRNLMFQTRLKAIPANLRWASQSGYPTARELALIQNEVQWHIPDFESSWPEPANVKWSGKRRRRPRRRNNRQNRDLNGAAGERNMPQGGTARAEA